MQCVQQFLTLLSILQTVSMSSVPGNSGKLEELSFGKYKHLKGHNYVPKIFSAMESV